MAGRVLHFGTDVCNRLLVLRKVGYAVDICPSLIEFRAALQERTDADAVLVAAKPRNERRQVVALTREKSQAGLILFDSSHSAVDEQEFDLVIPPLMRPEEWLRQIADLIERSRALYAESTAIREQSALLITDSEIARQQSKFERERSATERARLKKVIDRIKQKSEPSEKDQS